MALGDIKIRKPCHPGDANHTSLMIPSCSNIFIFGNEMPRTAFESKAQPNFVFLNERKYFFICYGILVTNDYELLVILNELSYILPEQTEWRIGDHNIRLLEQFYTLLTTKIAIFFKIMNPYFLRTWNPVTIFVPIILKINRRFTVIHA